MNTSRRQFFGLASGVCAAAWADLAMGENRPPVRSPRATDGDSKFEPDWDERLTITVGVGEGQIQGDSDKPIQAAIDYVARIGGGTVQLLPGTYTLRSSIWLPSGIRLRGSDSDTVITKIASEQVPLAKDSDWYDQEITLEEPGDFRVGDSVALLAKNVHDGGAIVIKRRIVARSGNRFKLDDGLRENLWLTGTPTCNSVFPLLTSSDTADVTIESLVLDGNREQNANFNGNYGGCVFLQDCNRYTIREVEARNYNGDGISFQICHDVVVDSCYSHDNADLGVHPGSGSQRPVIRDCRFENNTIGLFWCWGVKYGLAERNRIIGNRNYGISIGHNDTDNVMRHNEIENSGRVGILFRDDPRGADFWANRNVVEYNRIVNSGAESGVAIDIQGATKDARIAHNDLIENRDAADRIGIRVAETCERITLDNNQITGFSQAVVDQRKV